MTRKRFYLLALIAFGICALIFTSFLLNRHHPFIRRRPLSLRAPIRLKTARISEGTVAADASKNFAEHRTDAKTSSGHASGVTTQILLPPNQRYMSQAIVADVPASAQKKVIVIFNRPGWLFEKDPDYEKVFGTCPYSCTMTDDRRQLPNADAVWVDMARLNDRSPPSDRPPHQMWVAYNIESPVHYTGFHDSPAWRSVFNRTFSYRTDSDFFRPYGTFELRPEPAMKNYPQIMLNKTKPIAWFVSNCYTASKRERYVNELKKYIEVDTYGKCGSLLCRGLTQEKCFRVLNTTYFFYLSFENSYCGDYVTEKLFKTYRNLNVIPIVRGAVNYSHYLPPDTYLDTTNFSSPQHLASHLHLLMKDVSAYTRMLRTKDHFHTSFTSWVMPNLRPFCELCKTLQLSPPPHRVYPDIMTWTRQAKCRTPGGL